MSDWHDAMALEKANRRWRYGAGLLAAVLLAVLTVGAAAPDTVPDLLQARRIEVLSPAGRPVIVLSADEQQAALRLTARGPEHDRMVGLMAHRDGVHLALMKNKEAPLISARVDDNGSSLALFDGREPSQQPRGIILTSMCQGEEPMGATTVALTKGWRKEGVTAGLLMQDGEESVSLFLSGAERRSASMRVDQKTGKVAFVSEENKAIWSTP